MAEDLRFFIQAARGTGSTPLRRVPGSPPESTLEAAPPPSSSQRSESDQRPIKIVPRGLRSFDEHDVDFFLELLPGPRDRDGLPESIQFWKRRIEQRDPEMTFRVGLIYGPSGCGKSSMVKAGLLPRLAKHVLPVYSEATSDQTESRVLNGLRKLCPGLPPEAGLVDSLAAIRHGRVLLPAQKVLLVLDQFEQWLHVQRGRANTELVAALRQCDGERLQAIVLVRDDFWMAATSFFDDLEAELILRQNAVAVDLFDPRHARKVLRALGTAYGILPVRPADFSREQHSFLDEAIADLAQDGKIISVRLTLFAEMMKGKPWTPATLREVGGTQGIGLTFLEDTFGASTGAPRHRLHQKAARATLKALLPENGTDIKGQMRSRQELLEASRYVKRPRDFDDLVRILDGELRLITPTDPVGSSSEGQQATPGEQYYQLSHDYVVPSLRDWLTRKQRETRRGRAELRLAERLASWNAKPENRLLPITVEWANIRLLTRKKDWTEPERRMMKCAGRVHGLRALGTLVLISLISWAGWEGYGRLRASALVESLQRVGTPDVPAIVEQLPRYRRWADPQLVRVVRSTDDQSREHLHASLALLPVDATQVGYLFDRLSKATPTELPVLRNALETHRSTLTPKLWTVLESAKTGDPSLLPAASALASYDPENTKWEAVGGKVAQALVTINSIYLGPWLEALRPMRGRLTAPMVSIFRDKRPESEHTQATNILTDYASGDPDRLAELLMVSDSKAYLSLFPVAEKKAEQVLPMFQAELARRATYSWNDPPLNPSWTKPDAALVSRIESSQGILSERFAFCQTIPMDEFLTTAETLRMSGYRPIRFRPYSKEKTVRVAGIWTRDGRPWRMSSGLTDDEVREHDERNKKDNFLPVDAAGYETIDKAGLPADRYAALWVENTGDDDARLYVGVTTDDETEVQDKLKEAKLIPRTQHAVVGADGRTRYCGVSGRFPATAITGQTHRDQFEGNFEQNQAHQGDQLLIDAAISGASRAQTSQDRALAALARTDRELKTKPDDLDARLARALANLSLGENQKALDDLQFVIGKYPESIPAKRYKVIALARLGKKQDARSELAKFQKEQAAESSKLYLATVLAAELGEGADKAARDPGCRAQETAKGCRSEL